MMVKILKTFSNTNLFKTGILELQSFYNAHSSYTNDVRAKREISRIEKLQLTRY